MRPAPSRGRVPVDRLPDLPRLSVRYATGHPDASTFLPGTFDLPSIAGRARLVLERFARRSPIGAPEVDNLVAGQKAAVMAGQQVGLFGGPLLTAVKALAAVDLARELSAQVGAAAVFWCASEDHDLVEVTRFMVPGPEGPKELGPDPASLLENRSPVGALPIGLDLDALLAHAAEALSRPVDREALEAFRRLSAGKTFADGFIATMRWLLLRPDLVFVEAARREDKPDLVPLALRLVRERAEVRSILRERNGALEGAGYALQVRTDPMTLPLFALVGAERWLLTESGTGLALKGREGILDVEEVVGKFTSGEWLPSFSALTRPLAASVLYPVAATILGPAEIAYWAQAWPLFEWAAITPPVIVPRPLVALLPAAASRILEKLDLSVEDLLAGREAVLRRQGASRAQAVLGKVESLRRGTLEALEELDGELSAIDPALKKAAETTRQNVTFALGKLAERTAAAAGRADQMVESQVDRLLAEILPGGQLAERVFTAVPWLLRHGREAVIAALEAGLRWDEPGLKVIEL